MPKLTLSADKETIRKARKLAARNRTSISAMFDRFVRAVSSQPDDGPEPVGPITQELTGVLKSVRGKTYRKLVEDALSRKYRL